MDSSKEIRWLRPGYPPMDSLVRVTKDVEIQGHRLTSKMMGVVGESAYCSVIIDHIYECPVQFNKEGLPETLGVPWGVLEFAVQ